MAELKLHDRPWELTIEEREGEGEGERCGWGHAIGGRGLKEEASWEGAVGAGDCSWHLPIRSCVLREVEEKEEREKKKKRKEKRKKRKKCEKILKLEIF
jgi:hypothetical protein